MKSAIDTVKKLSNRFRPRYKVVIDVYWESDWDERLEVGETYSLEDAVKMYEDAWDDIYCGYKHITHTVKIHAGTDKSNSVIYSQTKYFGDTKCDIRTPSPFQKLQLKEYHAPPEKLQAAQLKLLELYEKHCR